ncbi:putative holin-like toxin [Bacillus niameyensis]
MEVSDREEVLLVSVFQALVLMISFASLIVAVIALSHKK